MTKMQIDLAFAIGWTGGIIGTFAWFMFFKKRTKPTKESQKEMWIDVARTHFHRYQHTDEGLQQLMDKYTITRKP